MIRRIKNLSFFVLLLALLVMAVPHFSRPAVAAPVADTFSDPVVEARARNLQRQLRCLVCQGESIDESHAELAADLRHLVRQQIAEGQSDRQIQDYLVARYGNFILMKPPMEPDTYVLWLAPFMVLIGATAVAIWVVSKARRNSL